jgi:hypothetical protein
VPHSTSHNNQTLRIIFPSCRDIKEPRARSQFSRPVEVSR